MSELLPQPENGDFLAASWFRDKFLLSVAEREAAYAVGDGTGAPEPTWWDARANWFGLQAWLDDPSGLPGAQKADNPPWYFSPEFGGESHLTWWAHSIAEYLNEDANGGLAPNVADSWRDQFVTYDTFWPAVDGNYANYRNALSKAGTSGASHGVLAAHYRDRPPHLGGTPEYEIDNLIGYIFGPWMLMDLMRMLSLAKHTVVYPSTMYADSAFTIWMNPYVPHTGIIWRRTRPSYRGGTEVPDWTAWTKIDEVTGKRYDCEPPPPPPSEFHFGESRQYAATVRWHFTYEGVAA